jgi:hypothetical protein
MTLDEMRKLAQQGPAIYLTLLRKRLPSRPKVRLMGNHGPLGRVCNIKEAEDGYRVVATFQSEEIVEWIDRRKRA